VFIGGETLSAHSARPRKIPGWIVLVREKFSVNKRAYRKKIERLIDLHLVGFCLFSFSISCLSSKKVENNSIRVLNWRAEENLLVSNKDNRAFMSWNFRSDSCPLEI